jgi:hypothetical protein
MVLVLVLPPSRPPPPCCCGPELWEACRRHLVRARLTSCTTSCGPPKRESCAAAAVVRCLARPCSCCHRRSGRGHRDGRDARCFALGDAPLPVPAQAEPVGEARPAGPRVTRRPAPACSVFRVPSRRRGRRFVPLPAGRRNGGAVPAGSVPRRPVGGAILGREHEARGDDDEAAAAGQHKRQQQLGGTATGAFGA